MFWTADCVDGNPTASEAERHTAPSSALSRISAPQTQKMSSRCVNFLPANHTDHANSGTTRSRYLRDSRALFLRVFRVFPGSTIPSAALSNFFAPSAFTLPRRFGSRLAALCPPRLNSGRRATDGPRLERRGRRGMREERRGKESRHFAIDSCAAGCS